MPRVSVLSPSTSPRTNLADQIAPIVGKPEVDSAVDASASRQRAQGKTRRRSARGGAQLPDDDHPRRRGHRHPRPLRHRGSRRK